MAVPQLQLANLGEIYAQNQARQASMDNVMMQQQSMLEQRQAQQAAAQREAAIRQAIANGVDPSTREGLGQLLRAGGSLEQFQSGMKNIGDIELAQARGEAAQRTAGAAETRALAAERTAAARERSTDAQIAKWGRDSNLNEQNTAIAWQNMQSKMSQQQIEIGANVARSLAGISDPKKRQKFYTQALPILRTSFPDYDLPKNVDDPYFTASLAVLGSMGKPPTASTEKPVAVSDPSSPTGFTYQVPNQAIGQPAPAPRGENIESSVQRFGRLADAFVGLDTNLGRLEGILGSETENLPGVGFFGGKAPEFALGPQGKALREATFAVANEIVKLYAGSAVTGQEAVRLGKQLGVDLNIEKGTFAMRGAPSETALRLGVKGIREVLDNRVKNLGASFSPQVIDTYQARGGVLPFGLQTPKGGETPTTETNAAAQPAPANGGQANDPLGLRQ